MNHRQVLSRPSGVVTFVEGKTQASGSEQPLCCRHAAMRFRVVNDKATVRFERRPGLFRKVLAAAGRQVTRVQVDESGAGKLFQFQYRIAQIQERQFRRKALT